MNKFIYIWINYLGNHANVIDYVYVAQGNLGVIQRKRAIESQQSYKRSFWYHIKCGEYPQNSCRHKPHQVF